MSNIPKTNDDNKQENINVKRGPFKPVVGSSPSKKSAKSKTSDYKSKSSRNKSKTPSVKSSRTPAGKSKTPSIKSSRTPGGKSKTPSVKSSRTPGDKNRNDVEQSKSSKAGKESSRSSRSKPESDTGKSDIAQKPTTSLHKPVATPAQTRPTMRAAPTQVNPGPGGAAPTAPGSSDAAQGNIRQGGSGGTAGNPDNPNEGTSQAGGQGPPPAAPNPAPGPSDPSGTDKESSHGFYLCYSPNGIDSREFVPISSKAAMMSSLITTMLNQKSPLKRNAGKDGKLYSGKKFTDVTHGSSVIVPLSNSACTTETLKRIAKWCEHHQNDQPWNPSARIDDFEIDEWDLEDDRMKEPISHWDWNFIIEASGRTNFANSNWDANKRGDFYDLMIAAYYLNLVGLVEMGGKFLTMQIKGKNENQVRGMLNLNTQPMQPAAGGANNPRM